MKQEWQDFVDVDTKKNYSMEEAVEKYNEVIKFLRSKKVRIISTPQCERQPLDSEYHLSDKDKEKYTLKYLMMNYTKESAEKIIKGVDAVYHFYDVTVEEAVETFEHARTNSITISEAIESTFGGMRIDELANFTSEIYLKIKEIYDHTAINTTVNAVKTAMLVHSMGNMLLNTTSKDDVKHEEE